MGCFASFSYHLLSTNDSAYFSVSGNIRSLQYFSSFYRNSFHKINNTLDLIKPTPPSSRNHHYPPPNRPHSSYSHPHLHSLASIAPKKLPFLLTTSSTALPLPSTTPIIKYFSLTLKPYPRIYHHFQRGAKLKIPQYRWVGGLREVVRTHTHEQCCSSILWGIMKFWPAGKKLTIEPYQLRY